MKEVDQIQELIKDMPTALVHAISLPLAISRKQVTRNLKLELGLTKKKITKHSKILHMNYARTHNSGMTKEKIKEFGWKRTEHPSNSPSRSLF